MFCKRQYTLKLATKAAMFTRDFLPELPPLLMSRADPPGMVCTQQRIIQPASNERNAAIETDKTT